MAFNAPPADNATRVGTSQAIPPGSLRFDPENVECKVPRIPPSGANEAQRAQPSEFLVQ
mgnify:CR=1 FL=1